MTKSEQEMRERMLAIANKPESFQDRKKRMDAFYGTNSYPPGPLPEVPVSDEDLEEEAEAEN